VKSRLAEDFLACFEKLPDAIKEQARKSYRLWKKDPYYPSLHFKRVHAKETIYSVRVGRGWRALGLVEGNSITWFWIGSHADYDKLLSQL
jgi:hypothetical protein